MKARIAAGAAALSQALDAGQIEKLDTLLTELERWGRRINLTAILEPADMVSGHLLDSLAVRPHLHGPRIIDIGTGAGFPGLPLAIAEPAMQFVLLDSNGKKISFVRHIVGLLRLSNVEVVKARAEDYAPGYRFDTVIARALASMPRLIELAAHLVGDQLLALKGRHPAEELAPIAAQPDWDYRVTELTVPGLEAHTRHVVSLYRKKTES